MLGRTLTKVNRNAISSRKRLPQPRVLRSEMDMRERARVKPAEAQYSRNFPALSLHPRRKVVMPDPTWQELYNAAIVEFDLTKLPERVEAASQAIHQYRVRKRQALSVVDRNQLDDALRVLFTLMRRAA